MQRQPAHDLPAKAAGTRPGHNPGPSWSHWSHQGKSPPGTSATHTLGPARLSEAIRASSLWRQQVWPAAALSPRPSRRPLLRTKGKGLVRSSTHLRDDLLGPLAPAPGRHQRSCMTRLTLAYLLVMVTFTSPHLQHPLLTPACPSLGYGSWIQAGHQAPPDTLPLPGATVLGCTCAPRVLSMSWFSTHHYEQIHIQIAHSFHWSPKRLCPWPGTVHCVMWMHAQSSQSQASWDMRWDSTVTRLPEGSGVQKHPDRWGSWAGGSTQQFSAAPCKVLPQGAVIQRARRVWEILVGQQHYGHGLGSPGRYTRVAMNLQCLSAARTQHF